MRRAASMSSTRRSKGMPRSISRSRNALVGMSIVSALLFFAVRADQAGFVLFRYFYFFVVALARELDLDPRLRDLGVGEAPLLGLVLLDRNLEEHTLFIAVEHASGDVAAVLEDRLDEAGLGTPPVARLGERTIGARRADFEDVGLLSQH